MVQQVGEGDHHSKVNTLVAVGNGSDQALDGKPDRALKPYHGSDEYKNCNRNNRKDFEHEPRFVEAIFMVQIVYQILQAVAEGSERCAPNRCNALNINGLTK